MHSDLPIPPPRIDAHRYTDQEHGWIDESKGFLRRDSLVPDLLEELHAVDVQGTVAVQARQTVQETDWLLSIAHETPAILGIVGWLPIASPELDRHFDRFAGETLVCGVRHVVQAEPDGFLDAPAFNAGIRKLQPAGLAYDILVFERQMPEAIRFVDRHSSQSFVLDHIAKPRIAANELEPWRTRIRELARRSNVTCKMSGMVTEADPLEWKPDQLRAYADVVLETFGPSRCMIGTDWPVLTTGCTYAQWWKLVEGWIAPLSRSEQAQILGGTAPGIYCLQHSLATIHKQQGGVPHGEHA